MTATNKVGSCASMSVSSVSQKPLVIMGATGMVGGYAVRYALDSPAVKSTTSIGRKKLSILHPKLKEVLHQNFADRLANHGYTIDPRGGDALPGDVHAELRTITAGYTIELARVLRNSSPNDDFSFLSGSGADQTGRSRLAFCTPQRRGREGFTRGRVSARLSFPPGIHLPCAGPKGTELQLPIDTCGLSAVSIAVSAPGRSR
jgi:hypothetical protein